MRLLPLLTALPGTHLPLLAEWARQFSSVPDPLDRLDALRRAQRRAEVDIRAVLSRLAAEFEVPSSDVACAMGSVRDTLDELTSEVERDLTCELEQADQY
ncbi:hypothetical protein [Reyranella sp.]|uniref:hypothetical protein n=1 Tax=Reyranella sp. TaxID=1929291 RepID=UPI004036436A